MCTIRFLAVLLVLNTAGFALAEAARQPSSTGPIQITIDASKAGPDISQFIYGQFIEHLGRCIYGGIWAEMLEDRKFYYDVNDDYRPYGDSPAGKFPIVSASPWQVTGQAESVEMNKDDAFVGEHSPQIAAGSGIRQKDLAVVAGREYVGYIWLKAADEKAKVTISLVSGDGKKNQNPATMIVNADEFTRFPFSFKASRTSDHAQLSIDVTEGPCLVGAVSLMPEDNVCGVRADTLALLKELHGTIYRWPGGNFVSGYNWRDGVGPRDERAPRKNPAWTGVEHNDFGIDEFVRLCRTIGAEPMIAVNTGFGDDYSAAQEVEYVNGPEDSIGGSWRTESGRDEPYDVKYWCVGNEMFGNWQLGHIPLKQYVLKHNLVAEAMRKVDPEILLVGSCDLDTQDSLGDGKNARHVGWSEGMLEQCADNMDFVSEHFYCGRVPWTKDGKVPVEQHVGLLREQIRKKAATHRELQAKLGRKPEDFIPIAMDEWNYWHREYVYGELGCQYNLADALGVAAGLHEYFRNSDIIKMAEYAQTVNVIGCVKTTKTAAFFDTTALPLLLYRREFGTQPLTVSGNPDENKLDIAAAKTEDGSAITVGVVNPQEKPVAIAAMFSGAKLAPKGTVWRITADSPDAINTAEKQAVAISEPQEISTSEKLIAPPFSASVFRIPLQQ
ncbi:MAG TPA: alpha-L-arabinofuranosidase C-terminal domain-containing protein [Lacipirellulaceae bacterium]|jgi:alpha-N-arabinofuranosidase|nr:alpha-L-arabinofuranosidase C-terminal domain-containing protein [Lacipirellulaceae bacterium]